MCLGKNMIPVVWVMVVLACGRQQRPPAHEGRRILEIPASSFGLDVGSFLGTEWALWRVGALVDTLVLHEPVMSLAVEARGTPCGRSWPVVECSWNGIRLGRFEVASSGWAWYRLDHRMEPGNGVLRIALLNDRFSPQGDLNLFVKSVVLSGEQR